MPEVGTSHAHLSAFTSDRTGANLPAEYGPWAFRKGFYLASEHDPIAAAVKEHGFVLIGAGAK